LLKNFPTCSSINLFYVFDCIVVFVRQIENGIFYHHHHKVHYAALPAEKK